MGRLLTTGALAAAVVLGASGAAQAYPQWQFSSGSSRCNQCHFAPAGSGLINGYGRDAAGDDLSTFPGDGSFAHGAVDLPGWLALGFDGRGAALWFDVGDPIGRQSAIFPMQSDIYARAAFSSAWSASVTAGYRGQVRQIDKPRDPGNFHAQTLDRVVSREHYVMWRPAATGPYARAGRFFAPYGLRLAEHTTYVRRDLGFNLLNETYNVSGGLVQERWELHLTAFAPDFVRHLGGTESGFAALYELRPTDFMSLGAQTRIAFADGASHTAAGLTGKVYVTPARSLLMTELDVVHSTFSGGKPVNGFVGYLGLTVFPVKGLWVGPFVERAQTSLAASDTATNAAGGQLNWFPYPHFELTVMGRLAQPSGAMTAKTLIAFLHYYL